MLFRARVVIVLLLSLGSAGCSVGIGSMAPGIDTWVFGEVSGRRYFLRGKEVSSGSNFDSSSTSYRSRSLKSSLGLSFGGDLGASALSTPGWSRTGWGIASVASIQGRFCPGADLCLGADVGKVGAESGVSRPYSTVDGTYEQKGILGIDGWIVKPVVQLSLFEPVWIEAGIGGSKTALRYKQGNLDVVRSDRAWNLLWSAGAGVAFNESLGLRVQYTHLATDGMISGENLKATGSMWTVSLLID